MGGLGIFGIPNYLNPTGTGESGLVGVLLGIGIAAVVAFVLTTILWKDKSEEEEGPKEKASADIKQETILSPMAGTTIPLEQVKDEAFSQGILGRGIAVRPLDGEVYAPFTGTVETLFPTKHAIGLVSDKGCELLIHIGFDTVKLEGRHFTAHVKQGDHVVKGQKLLSFDKEQMEKEGYVLDTPVIVTNFDQYADIAGQNETDVKPGDVLLTALK